MPYSGTDLAKSFESLIKPGLKVLGTGIASAAMLNPVAAPIVTFALTPIIQANISDYAQKAETRLA